MLAKSRLLAAAITLLLCSSCTQPPPPTPTPVATAAPAGDRQPRTGDIAAAGKVLPPP
ncbi:MAG: hypothetical protein IPK16_08875 [Anaerolineales bacterium]|nr:hypothetical protein [Anaerolineales bacterium]